MEQENRQVDAEWERALDARIRVQPDLTAPRALIPSVMARVRTVEAAPWWHRAWWMWPRPVQILSIVLCSAAIATLSLLYWEVREALLASYLHVAWQEGLAQLDPFWRALSALGTAVELVVQRYCGFACLAAMAMCLSLYLSCVGLGTMMYRLALPVRLNR